MEGAENILSEYKDYLFASGKAEKTIASYSGDIRGFIAWLNEKNVDYKVNITRFYITSYKSYMQEHSYSINTYNKKINSLISFNEFLMSAKYMREIVVEAKDKLKIAAGSEGEVEIFNDEEVQRILFNIQNIKNSNLRDKVVVMILLYAGLRVSELVSIKLKNIDYLTQQLLVIGKGNKTREVPLKQEVLDSIKEYIQTERKENKHIDSEYLLLTQRAGKMDKDTVNKILNRIGNVLKIEMYPHKFRHTFCTMLLKKQVPISTVSKLAGHASIETTSKFYINTSRQ